MAGRGEVVLHIEADSSLAQEWCLVRRVWRERISKEWWHLEIVRAAWDRMVGLTHPRAWSTMRRLSDYLRDGSC